MTSNRHKAVWIAAVVVVVGTAGLLVFLANRERPYDPSFDARVARPAYGAERPLVLYDEGHLNTHTADAGDRPFADLVRNDGYEVRISREPITAERLSGVSVLVIVLARGANDANDAPAFSDSETAVIDRWVRGG